MKLKLGFTVVGCLASLGLLFAPAAIQAATMVGPGGVTVDFSSAPTVAQGWSTGILPTISPANGPQTYQTAAALEAAVQALTASDYSSPIPIQTSGTATGTTAMYFPAGQQLRMMPTNSAAVGLLATLQNATGGPLTTLSVSYDFSLMNTPGGEEIPGWMAFYSLTGNAGDWVLIPEFTTDIPANSSSLLSADLDLGLWPDGSPLYLLWVDDNSIVNPDGNYGFTNFSAVGSVVPEPASIALWSLLALAGAAYAATRRRRSKAPA